MVMRETAGSSVGPTDSESMLKPRRRTIEATRLSTPGLVLDEDREQAALAHDASTKSSMPLPSGTIG